jgi:hypothetical protein
MLWLTGTKHNNATRPYRLPPSVQQKVANTSFHIKNVIITSSERPVTASVVEVNVLNAAAVDLEIFRRTTIGGCL